MGPLAFLSLGQSQTGQIDAILQPGNLQELSYFTNDGEFFNYTQVNELYPEENLSPRCLFGYTYIWNLDVNDWYTSQIYAIKTDREREIELGTRYNYQPLKINECIISSARAKELNVTVGMNVGMRLRWTKTIDAIVEDYNVIA